MMACSVLRLTMISRQVLRPCHAFLQTVRADLENPQPGGPVALARSFALTAAGQPLPDFLHSGWLQQLKAHGDGAQVHLAPAAHITHAAALIAEPVGSTGPALPLMSARSSVCGYVRITSRGRQQTAEHHAVAAFHAVATEQLVSQSYERLQQKLQTGDEAEVLNTLMVEASPLTYKDIVHHARSTARLDKALHAWHLRCQSASGWLMRACQCRLGVNLLSWLRRRRLRQILIAHPDSAELLSTTHCCVAGRPAPQEAPCRGAQCTAAGAA